MDIDLLMVDLAEVYGIQHGACRKRLVGALLLAEDGREFRGANGFRQPSGGCLEGGCKRGETMDKSQPCIALHAEEAAVIAAGDGAIGARVWVSHRPCENCVRFMRAAGVARVAFFAGGVIEVIEFSLSHSDR